MPLDRSERQDVASRIQLHVPFLRRRPELGSRLSSFGADERVTMDRWVFDGQPRFIGTGEPSVGDHEIHDAEGLGPDHALIVHERALFSFPRDATPLETDEGLVALRYDDLPGFEHTDWAFTTFGLTSRTSTDGAVRLVVASKTNNSEPELTRITWLDVVLAPPSIRPVASTTVAGAVTFSTGVVDALGRVMFLVKLDQDDTPRIERQVVLIADREPRLARIVSRESSIFSMVGATPLAEVPHLVAYEDGLVLGTDLLSDRGPGFEARLPPAIGGGPAALDAVSGPVGLLVFAAGEQGDDLWYDFAEDRWTIPRPITG